MAMKHLYDDDQGNDLTISIVPELRKRITIAAAQGNLSVQEYIEHILDQMVPPDPISIQQRSGQINRAAIDDLLRYRDEIKSAHPGQVLEDSSDILYQAREERIKDLEQQ